METTLVEQRKHDHVPRLKAAEVSEASRQRSGIAPPAPIRTDSRYLPPTSQQLAWLAELGDNEPVPPMAWMAVERSIALQRQASATPPSPARRRPRPRRARPLAPPRAVPERYWTTGSPAVRPEQPQDLAVSNSQGLGALIRVRQQASLADRQAFRQWVNAPPVADVALLPTSAQTQRYAAEIARICGVDAARCTRRKGGPQA